MAINLLSERVTAVIEPAAGGRLLSLLVDGHDVMGSVPDNTLAELLGDVPEAHHDWYRGSFLSTGACPALVPVVVLTSVVGKTGPFC